ncbi:MAG: SDR family NAD(P)-dependent oxidoreductase, partial [Roseovarius sp.]|nr:SDR family NAD(P)-dependent oxidoreductase [Roseovarius sp.]
MRLSDGLAVVTGAGGGLGRALALELAARGQHVVALGRAPEGISETAAMDPSGRITPVTADVADPEALRTAFAQITQTAPVTL